MTIKVLISEDHELYRDGLRLLLQDAFGDIVVLESSDFDTTKFLLSDHSDIDFVLFDINIPGTTGLLGLTEIKQRYPTLPVIVVSTVDYRASIQQMLQLGADGYIAKTTPKAVMIKAFQDIMAGEHVVISDNTPGDGIDVSPRQLDILQCLATGMPNKEIAVQLTIVSSTVREHVSDLLKIFDCENRTQLVLRARQLGFILD